MLRSCKEKNLKKKNVKYVQYACMTAEERQVLVMITILRGVNTNRVKIYLRIVEEGIITCNGIK